MSEREPSMPTPAELFKEKAAASREVLSADILRENLDQWSKIAGIEGKDRELFQRLLEISAIGTYADSEENRLKSDNYPDSIDVKPEQRARGERAVVGRHLAIPAAASGGTELFQDYDELLMTDSPVKLVIPRQAAQEIINEFNDRHQDEVATCHTPYEFYIHGLGARSGMENSNPEKSDRVVKDNARRLAEITRAEIAEMEAAA